MLLAKAGGWRAVVAAAAMLVAAGSGVVDAEADTGVPGRQAYRTNCSLPNIDTGGRTCTYTFEYTGTIEPFVVPPSTTPVKITAVGAPGAGKPGFRGRGATVTASFPNLSGVPILVTVGGEGAVDGYNGGGLGGGGGASDVRLGGHEFEHRIIVAGGGGGWGDEMIVDELGTARLIPVKGGDAGQAGLGSGGQPGTSTEGGKGGGTEYGPGGEGSLGRGGSGGYGTGGGGGGFYGGGGGGACTGTDAENTALCLHSQPGSGGGGSSLIPPGGSYILADDFTPRISITVTQYGWWGHP